MMKKSINYWGIVGFAILYVVTVYATAFLGFIHPLGWVAFPVAAALLGAFSYYWVATRWQRFGAGTLLGLVLGLFLLATGDGTLQTLAITVAVGLLSDGVRLWVGNTTKNGTLWAYPMLSIAVIGWNLPIWTNTQLCHDHAIEEMGSDYADGLVQYAQWWILLLLVVATMAFAYVGIRIAIAAMKKATSRFEE